MRKSSSNKQLKLLQVRHSLDQIFLGVNQDELDRIDRIHQYMVAPEKFELNSKDLSYYENLQLVFSILSTNISHLGAQEKILEVFPELSKRNDLIRKLIYDAKQLYGTFTAVLKEFDRAVLAERYLEIADRCKFAGMFDEERKALDSYMSLMDLKEVSKPEPKIEVVPQISFTTEWEEVEDAEIDEESLPK